MKSQLLLTPYSAFTLFYFVILIGDSHGKSEHLTSRTISGLGP